MADEKRLRPMSCTAVQLSLWVTALLVLPVTFLNAEVRHVPLDYPTIQAGINAAQEGDTVLIEPGTYAEALRTGPYAGLTLKGNTTVDSLRPVIDPTPLPGSDTLACLIASVPSLVLEDLTFRNGAAMYPRDRTDVGGVRLASGTLTARRCRFDSTHNAIDAEYCPVRLDQCAFRHVHGFCVRNHPEPLIADDCGFHGLSTWSLIQSGDSTLVTRCHLSCLPQSSELMLVDPRGTVIRDCVIGPFGPTGAGAIIPVYWGSMQVLNNVFTGCQCNNQLIRFSSQCDAPPSLLRGNVFINNEGVAGLHPILVNASLRDINSPCTIVVIDSNQFVSCPASAYRGTGPAPFTRNRFQDLTTSSSAAVNVELNPEPIRDNLFLRTARAVSSNELMVCDARWNWWGDSTGPYHLYENPEGRGDSVSRWVTVDPWYADTAFWLKEAPHRIVLPQQFSLTAYPNPFNHQCRLKLEVPRPEIVRVELYDVLGRRVKELWSGAVGIDKDIMVDDSALASGIYFARVCDTIQGRTLATVKLALLK